MGYIRVFINDVLMNSLSITNKEFVTDFKMNKKRRDYIKKYLKKGKFLIKSNIVISKKFPERYKKRGYYNRKIRKGDFIDRNKQYFPIMANLCEKYYKNFNNILEIGAGFGRFVDIFVRKFNPKYYDVCEFSEASKGIYEYIKLLPEEITTDIKIIEKSFMDIVDLRQYDALIAIEVLEHTMYDKIFLDRLKKGTFVFFAVPTRHAEAHVQAFLTPNSVWYRYKDILKIYEIKEIMKPKVIDYPTQWGVVAEKK